LKAQLDYFGLCASCREKILFGWVEDHKDQAAAITAPTSTKPPVEIATDGNILALAAKYGLSIQADLVALNISAEVLALVPRSVCERDRVLPLGLTGDLLQVATCVPGNVFTEQNLKALSGYEVEFRLVTVHALAAKISDCFDGPVPECGVTEVFPLPAEEKKPLVIATDENIHDLAKQYGVPMIDLAAMEIEPDVLKAVPREICERHNLIPINRSGASIILAMCDPSNIYAMDDIKFLTGYNVEAVLATKVEIKAKIAACYENLLAAEEDHHLGVLRARTSVHAEDLSAEDLATLKQSQELDDVFVHHFYFGAFLQHGGEFHEALTQYLFARAAFRDMRGEDVCNSSVELWIAECLFALMISGSPRPVDEIKKEIEQALVSGWQALKEEPRREWTNWNIRLEKGFLSLAEKVGFNIRAF
jgi:hypothetical protein